MASFATDGSDVCQLTSANGSSRPLGGREWNTAGALVEANADPAYSVNELFVVSANDPCVANQIGLDLMEDENAGFEDATWSADGRWVTAVLGSSFDSGGELPVIMVSSDDSTSEVLVPGGINESPLFSPGGNRIYYSQAELMNKHGSAADSRLWTVDVTSRETHPSIDLPAGWSAQLRGWTKDGYLIMDLSASEASFYGSSKSRVAVVDSTTGDVIYLSAQRDFTNYLGFVAQ